MQIGVDEKAFVDFPCRCGFVTDVGRIRKENQDTCLADPANGLFLVSDGMGGQQAGSLAAKVVTEILPKLIHQRLKKLGQARTRAIRYWLRMDVLAFSKWLRAESSARTEMRGMGATLVAALIRGNRAHITHMGDSRAYLFRDGRLTQLTDDHSVVGLLLRNGEITDEEAANHPARGQLIRYIGMEAEVYPDARTLALNPGDRLLLCSDGLTGMVTDQTIAETLTSQTDPQTACHLLVDAANAAGGYDNITVLIADYQDSGKSGGSQE